MRIVDATVDLVELPAQPVFRWRDGLPGSEPPVTGGILRLRTDEGLVGEAHTRRGVIVADLVNRVIRGEIVGADPLAREFLWRRMWELDRREEFPIYALGLVDIALWDIAGKAAGLPVHRLAGGFRESIPAYASTVTYGSVQEYLDVVDQCLAHGYQAVKVHAWGDVRRDSELVTRLRAHVGDDLPLMYDGSAAFDLAGAIQLGHALSDAGFLWYEEPMREFNVTAHRWLADNVGVSLLVGETADGAHMNTADFISSGCATSVRTSPHLKGGITGALRIAHLAEAYLMNAEVHGSGLLQRQLCMAVPNTTYYESQIIGNPIIPDPHVDADGMVRAPSAPGVGYDARPAPDEFGDTALSRA
ncbi:racemase [Jiangella ureilytica]|uniref:Racemase n=1 Tax=Jiangella ureilytica TaxID=2530374 RepID=A0A4R4RBJ0_9ACTN|nr:enolase C-terminal domain-like protein [Jiangella ureilytica]TDC46514.1 racemase [Jiangella ureilytica]